MPPSTHLVPLPFFSETLWTHSPIGRRSQEVNAVYVDRFRGPRLATASTSHDFWEFTAVLSGEGRLEGAKDRTLSQWEVCLVPPETAHRESSKGIMDTIWLGFRSPRLDPLGTKLQKIASVHCRALTEEIERFWIFSKQSGGAVGPELDAHCALILSRFLRFSEEGNRPENDWVGRVLRHMEEHFAQPVEIGALARQYGCSTGYLYRQFRQKTGHSPQSWLSRLRLGHALRLLQHSDLAIAEIAASVGYDDPLYFSRKFRRSTGESPSNFRRNHRAPV